MLVEKIQSKKKLYDLELTRMILIQNIPQIRMIPNNDDVMLEKIESSLANTIPLWRHQMVVSIGIEHSQRAIKGQNRLSAKSY